MENNQTIAEQLNIKEFPFEIKDKNGKIIYFEDSNKYWEKSEYNQNGKLIYWENSEKNWGKRVYDENGNITYLENSLGQIIDNRPKEITMDEIAKAFNIPVKNLKIKK